MILVDGAIWPWRGRRWAHLVSDRSYAELHRFAANLGLPRVGFQGDHYDVDEPTRVRALAAGARAVDSRELLRRLRGAGLRRPAGPPWRWRVVAEWPISSFPAEVLWPAEATALVEAGIEELARSWRSADVPPTCVLRVMTRPGERAAVMVDMGGPPAAPLAELVLELPEEGETWRRVRVT